jgi:hypothetical protein
VVSGILVLAHSLFSPMLGADKRLDMGAVHHVSSPLSFRIALIPLFVKQIKSSRIMQLLQPKVRELQKKHGHDREKLGQETMKLYRENNANSAGVLLAVAAPDSYLPRAVPGARRRGARHPPRSLAVVNPTL